MKARRFPRTAADEPGGAPATSSLIDVAFLLLVYFLVTSTLDPREGDLSLTLAGIPTPGTVVHERAPISVDAGGRVTMGGELLDVDPASRDLPLLADRLRTFVEAGGILSAGRPPAVDLEVDDAVPGQRFIDVINCLAGAGISDVAIADFDASSGR